MPTTTQYYHTRDPIENLCVRVTARKVQHGGHHRSIAIGATWGCSFHWQAKWSASSDARTHAKKTQAKKKDKAAEGADDQLIERVSPVNQEREHDGVALVSYTDADQIKATSRHVVTPLNDQQLCFPATDSTPITPTLANKGGPVEARERREETFKRMHLVLRLTDGHDETEDLVLASMRYYPLTGLLCSTPPFSTCIPDDDESGDQPRLSTYRITSRTTGEQFEYALDNENDLFPAAYQDDQRLLRELLRQELIEEQARVEEWRNKHGEGALVKRPTEKEAPAPEEKDRIMVLVEVVSVTGALPVDPVLVETVVHTSSDAELGWRLAHCGTRARSRLARPVVKDNGGEIAAFVHHIQLPFERPRPSKLRATGEYPLPIERPSLRLTVSSIDSWKREHLVGCADLHVPVVPGFIDTEVSLWCPRLSAQEQMEEFFLGSEANDYPGTPVTVHAPDHKAALRTRFGMQTISLDARLRVRFHTICWVPIADPPAKALPPVVATGVVKRSVDEILQSVKLNRRAAELSGTLPPIPMATSSAVLELLAKVKSTSSKGTTSSAG